MFAALAKLEGQIGKKLGDPENPLLVSVRSGAKFSMPGMMNTILNLGLNDKTVEGLAKRSGNPRFAYDSYRRFIQMFGEVALNIGMEKFDHIFDTRKHKAKTKLDTDLSAKDLAGDHRGLQEARPEGNQEAFPAGCARAADHVPRCRVSLLVESQGGVLPQDGKDSGRHRHGCQRPGHGVRQHRRYVGDRRRFHARSRHRRKAVLRRVPGECPGRGRGRRHPHAAGDLRARKDHAGRLQPVARDHGEPRKTLSRHAGFRVHHRRRQAVHAPDPQRKTHRPGGGARRGGDEGRRPDQQGRGGSARRAAAARSATAPDFRRALAQEAGEHRDGNRCQPGSRCWTRRLHGGRRSRDEQAAVR